METILSIAGRAGLFRLVNRAKNMLVVETIDSARRRQPAFGTEKIIALNDIMVYTDTDEVPLWQVLAAVADKEKQATSSLDYKRCSAEDLHRYFAEVLPAYDRERVHDSDMRRLVQWYNILVAGGYTDFEALLSAKKQ